MARPGVSGLAVVLAAGGGLLAYTGLTGQNVPDAVRTILSNGKLAAPSRVPASPLTAPPAAGAPAAGGTAGGARGGLAAAAMAYIGTPYRFGGHAPGGFDCSGLVTYVLVKDRGVNLAKYSAFGKPLSNTHTVTGQWYVTDFATTVARNACREGDLVCWPSHIGIALNGSEMVHAPAPGQKVKISKIWGGATIRRPKEG